MSLSSPLPYHTSYNRHVQSSGTSVAYLAYNLRLGNKVSIHYVLVSVRERIDQNLVLLATFVFVCPSLSAVCSLQITTPMTGILKKKDREANTKHCRGVHFLCLCWNVMNHSSCQVQVAVYVHILPLKANLYSQFNLPDGCKISTQHPGFKTSTQPYLYYASCSNTQD